MLTVTSVQLNAWIAMVIWPLSRILALIASAPITGNQQFPLSAKIGFSILLTILVAPLLPAAAMDPASGAGVLLLAREVLIGLAMGLAMRVVFAGVSMAGDLIGLQMGLGFAQFYDPQNNTQAPVTAQFLGLIATLLFLSFNGHLMLISTLVESFQTAPVHANGGLAGNALVLAQWGGVIMRAALMLSLPLVAVLLVTNIALGVLSRAAAQLNIFAIGFPVTLGIGFVALLAGLPYMSPVMDKLFTEGLQVMLRVATLKAG